VIFQRVEVEGSVVDVRVADGRVAEIQPHLAHRHETEIVDGRGGVLLPGLHDHHLHLFALAAANASVDCSGGLQALRDAPGSGWIRGVAFDGMVDRHRLDAFVPDRPVRVQHRSGALWMLNSKALGCLNLDDTPDVERDDRGEPIGRLWRYDARMREAMSGDPPDLLPVVERLRGLGITSVTDATPDLDTVSAAALASAPLSIVSLGDPDGSAPVKLHLRDHDLPTYPELVETVADVHGRGRAVAVHCVTRESLLLTLAVLDQVGHMPDDRIEHASVVPEPEALRGLTAVTQPGFVAARGDQYLTAVEPDDLPHLYRYRSLLDVGVNVLPSSDAPYGPLDPWAVIRAARDRLTASGQLLGADERVDPRIVLDGYLRDGAGLRRRVAVGARADLILMEGPLSEVLGEPDSGRVRLTVVGSDGSALIHV
jgi:predicted amidohydrolase YtcJ